MEKYNHNLYLKDREDVISKSKNTDLIRRIFGSEFPSSDSEDIFKFHNDNFKAPAYIETEKFGILFTMKGGSSYIMNVLDELELTKVPSLLTSNFNEVFSSIMRIENEDIETTQYKEFLKILEGKSKKDLIIVTRNPIYKWISGIYQEMEVEYKNSKTLKYVISKKYNQEAPTRGMDQLNDDAFEEFVCNILEYGLKEGDGVAWAHASLYNEVFYNLLEVNPNIDKSKLKIIDIDANDGNLTDILGLYYPEVKSHDLSNRFSTHRNSYERILLAIRGNILGRNIALEKAINKRISQDYYYYTLLKHKYKKYFFKK